MAGALIGATSASAAIEVGDDCAANTAEGPYSLIPEAHASAGGLPLATPVGGVVTSWKVASAYPEPIPQRLGAFRPAGSAGTFGLIGDSDEEEVGTGVHSFSTRIPVQAGDRFGPIAVINDTLFCSTGNEGDKVWAFVGSVGTGSTHTYMAATLVRVPMVVTIEPDADGDGYGDETQDKCPQNPAFQSACPAAPPVTLDAFPIALKQSILLLVSSSSETPVTVSGQTQWGLRPKPGKARSSRTLVVGLSGGTQTVKPGTVAPFNVKLPKSVKRRLADLPPSQTLKATLTASAKDSAGRLSARTVTVRLRGRASSG
jgi:hypothetical protein